MRVTVATRWLAVFGLILGLCAGAGWAQDHCTSSFGCKRRTGDERKECPKCSKRKIPAEHAMCSICSIREGVCGHCGLPRQGVSKRNGRNGKGVKGGSDSLGKARKTTREVVLQLSAKSHGELQGYFCQDVVEVRGGGLPALPETRPFLIRLSGVSPSAAASLASALKKKLGDDVDQAVIEVWDTSNDFGYFRNVAAAIKKAEPKIVVGGPGRLTIHDRNGLRNFNANVKNADYLSGCFNNGQEYAHHKYTEGSLRLFGNSKIQYDTIYDITAEIAGKINYPPNTKIGLTAFAYNGKVPGNSPEDRAYAATVIVNFAVVNIQRNNKTEGRPIVLCPMDPKLAEAIQSGYEMLWPKRTGDNGEPWDFIAKPECYTIPITGIATRNPKTGQIYIVGVNNSTEHVKATAKIPGRPDVEMYFDPCEVKLIKP